MYNVFRKLVNGELVLVRSYAELEEAKWVVTLFNECWPGEYCLRETGSGADVEI
jgi:hypothetical protein